MKLSVLIFLVLAINSFSQATDDKCSKQDKCGNFMSAADKFLAGEGETHDQTSQKGIVSTPNGIFPVYDNKASISKEKAQAKPDLPKNVDKEWENKTLNPPPKILNTPTKSPDGEKILENPLFIFLWLGIFIFLYYYFKEKKKRKKRE